LPRKGLADILDQIADTSSTLTIGEGKRVRPHEPRSGELVRSFQTAVTGENHLNVIPHPVACLKWAGLRGHRFVMATARGAAQHIPQVSKR
jgi:hypothetical protein